MTTSNPDTSKITASESQPKRIDEPIYTYTVSWGWLIAGAICLLLFGSIAGVAYSVQTWNLSTRIIAVVGQMVDEAELAKDKMALEENLAEQGRLWQTSLKRRSDAANLLNRFRQTNPGEANEVILSKLYDILESLYEDYGKGGTPAGLQRGEQLSNLATSLIQTVDAAGSIKYRKRLLELEWDRRNFEGIIFRGKELFVAAQALQDMENFDAMRYITMALFDNLHVQPYDNQELQLPQAFPDTMDALLEKLNTREPGDIEIAKRYADFLVSVGKEDRVNFTRSASDALARRALADRFSLASDRMEAMVLRNPDETDAYLARYQFLAQYSTSDEIDLPSPDLRRVLELSPDSNRGLILSAFHAIQQSRIAAKGGELERAARWIEEAEGHFRRTVKANPGDPLGYQYLGEYLLDTGNAREAIDVWNEGLKNSRNFSENEELIGRLVMQLLQHNMIDEARARLGDLSRTIDDMRQTRPRDVRRTRDMQTLLTAWLYSTEANVAASRLEVVQRENRRDEMQQLFGVIQQRRAEAVQRFEEVLVDFGTLQEHYLIERRSVYYQLLPLSLLQLARLKGESQQWDHAATYYRRASRFPVPAVLHRAYIGMSLAYQQLNRLDEATAALAEAARLFPEDSSFQYEHAMMFFRSQVSTNAATPAGLDAVQKELESLEAFRNGLSQPWILDIRLIHLGVVRANLTNQADTILAAMDDALVKFRRLERKQDTAGNAINFVRDADDNIVHYIDDPAFVTEMVGIYSSLASRTDFDRLLEKLREFPDGEDDYFGARIYDALRRDSRNEAIEIIDEAITSTRLSSERKDRFVGLLQNLRGEDTDSVSFLEKAYTQLKTTFDESPESLRPQGFVMLAELSLDREDDKTVRMIRERLFRLEGPAGTHWRYIDVRLKLAEKDLDYAGMREIQEVIARYSPEWDKTHLLSAMIEERYLESSPGDTVARDRLIAAYRSAIRFGNMNSEVWNRLMTHLEDAGRSDEARLVRRDAALRGITLEGRMGQLPQPYGRMYSQVQEAIANEDAIDADTIARQCIQLAEARGERDALIFTLHLTMGKLFLDADVFDSAKRHLRETAKSGGSFIYPLALCVARSGDVDAGFTMLLDEIDLVPSMMPVLLPAVLVLMSQVQPSDEVFERIDLLMDRIERGERLKLRGVLPDGAEKDHEITLGTKWVDSRKAVTLVVRLPEQTGNLDPEVIQFFSPEDYVE